MSGQESKKLFQQARKLIPGGVNSPVRAFRAVGGEPFFVERAEGCRLWDADGKEYIDYVGSWGPMLLGHAHPAVIEAVKDAAGRGTSYGTPTADEVKLAELVVRAIPSVEMVRLVNSGTEATMSALRLARGITKRDVVIKLEGGYHGHADSFLVAAGSGVATLGIPGSPGVPEPIAQLTATLPFNDLESMKEIFAQRGSEIAAIIVEPVAGNMGVVPPRDGYLQGLRELCSEHGALLIFDEVMTGFRVALGGAQTRYGVTPDLTTLGKIIGGGLPVGAIAGPEKLLSQLAPEGPIYQAGTLSGNPLAMAAGRATLETLFADESAYDRLEASSAKLEAGLLDAAKEADIPVTASRVGSMMTLFLTGTPVTCFTDAKSADTALYGRLFHALVERGYFIAPSAFEAMFISLAHDDKDIEATISAFSEAFSEAKE